MPGTYRNLKQWATESKLKGADVFRETSFVSRIGSGSDYMPSGTFKRAIGKTPEDYGLKMFSGCDSDNKTVHPPIFRPYGGIFPYLFGAGAMLHAPFALQCLDGVAFAVHRGIVNLDFDCGGDKHGGGGGGGNMAGGGGPGEGGGGGGWGRTRLIAIASRTTFSEPLGAPLPAFAAASAAAMALSVQTSALSISTTDATSWPGARPPPAAVVASRTAAVRASKHERAEVMSMFAPPVGACLFTECFFAHAHGSATQKNDAQENGQREAARGDSRRRLTRRDAGHAV